ncbi:hypothetical protein [Streptomyces sp. NBC_00892]|uniref:hypothetical protein n=1 Tax=Streptomyces sp. NBC_00892 TaxID=2975861 RepID=UPI0022530708|nr:hypothetical protein [Streptomyces sp. NBC_00892]MCX4902547.1 hypothetical protein [Streptomyces sp. NBC_00892]
MTPEKNVVREATKSVVRKSTSLGEGEKLSRRTAWEHFCTPTPLSDDEWIGELALQLGAFSVHDHDLAEVAANYDQLVKRSRALDDHLDETTVLCGLLVVRVLRDKLLLDEQRLMKAAREKKISWARIAGASELKSRQSAERRYLQLRSDLDDVAGDNLTQAERVEVARARRNRFSEHVWASRHATRIVRLARRLNTVPDLQQRADRSSEAQAARERAVNDAVYNGRPVPEHTLTPWPGRLRETLDAYEAHARAARGEQATAHHPSTLLPPAALNKLLHELFGLVGYAADAVVAEDHPDLAQEVRSLYEEAGTAAPRVLLA